MGRVVGERKGEGGGEWGERAGIKNEGGKRGE